MRTGGKGCFPLSWQGNTPGGTGRTGGNQGCLDSQIFHNIYKNLRQLLPKAEVMSGENHFRKSFQIRLGPSHSDLNCTEPSSFTVNICAGCGGYGGKGSRMQKPTTGWTLTLDFPCLLPISPWLVVWEGKAINILHF